MGSSPIVLSGNGGGGWGLVWHRQNNHYNTTNHNVNSSKNNSSGNCSNNNNESCVSIFSFGYFLFSFVLLGWIASLYAKLMLTPNVRTSLSAFGCREDAEGAWSIGVFYGDSPFSLKPIEDMNVWSDKNAAWPVANPVVSCASVSEAGFPSNFVADPFLYVQDNDEEIDNKAQKYLRGQSANLETLQDKKLKGQLAAREDLYGKNARTAAKIEKWLMPSGGGYLEAEGIEKTWRFKQEDIAQEINILSSKNQYDIVLPDFGPYKLDFTASGQYMALAGRKGHLAIMDMKNMSLIKELQVRETVRDVAFLHNELFFVAAQKKYPYIYYRDGTELHCLKEHGAVLKLQFLKNHFLLSSINKFGQLHYQDITTGQMVGNFRTGYGRSNVLQANPFNSVLGVGHNKGTVTMWKPTSSAPLVKMLCHQGPLTALAFHTNGHLMATAGMERKIKLWDLRKYEVLQTLPQHAKTLDFSQKGLLAAATGSFVQVFGDQSGSQSYGKYMGHSICKGYQIEKVTFRPYEDVLAIGHSKGWSSILIPGSGEPNFDSWVANPYETPKQRREKEVRSLLDKLPPETIMLDPTKIGTLKPSRKKEKPTKEETEAEKEAAVEAVKKKAQKKKTKGRSRPSRVAAKKQGAIENAKKPFIESADKEEGIKKRKLSSVETDLPKSLQRFVKKKVT